MEKFVALLRGINVGGNKKVPMADLKTVFEKLGYKNVKTILASGNVIFEAPEKNTDKLAKTIGPAMEKKFKFPIPLLIRPASGIEKMLAKDPFKKIKVTQETRLYVTFLPEKTKSKLPIPYKSPDGSFEILRMEDDALFSHLDLTKTGTIEVMNVLEKEFGKNITTRNWNTVQKLVK
jgi:uncharacterized protein (DUF1697 family)